jgi:hypothetical protein
VKQREEESRSSNMQELFEGGEELLLSGVVGDMSMGGTDVDGMLDHDYTETQTTSQMVHNGYENTNDDFLPDDFLNFD